MPARLEHVEALATEWATVAARMLRPDHCIYAARALIDLLGDDHAQVVVMDAVAENRLAHEIGTVDPATGRQRPGTWTVGVVGTDPIQPGGYRGHLVVMAAVEDTDGEVALRLVDMTAPQFDRPNRGIRVRRPLVLDPALSVASTLLPGGRAFDLAECGAGIGWMNYAVQAHPDDYRNAPNWRNPEHVDRFRDLWATITAGSLTQREQEG